MSRATSISSQFRRIRYFFVDIQENPTGTVCTCSSTEEIIRSAEINRYSNHVDICFLLLAALVIVNAVPYQLLKRGRDIGLPCSANPSSSSIYANLKPFPPVSNQSVDYTVLDFHYAKAATFSIDVPDVPTPLLPSKYAITVIIADNPNKPKIHACSYAIFG
ncbi:hypothetical protein GLOIN_2v1781977 [Rhizophagus irregularis DAOM 181602=DAOM 197198]|uniref:Uncharacterized protein n=1 Tax=Rhizophagus irregularis (strain DAOM 181602 / DAOM 197198 / MUCL 43194) TaxID=747089 RepID=A0A2P4PIG8_RHIID|nr:hypothetical protein GLOIN_2v1781977 [Rhizophagus irregularis DAOM 181602=DAOM 197198]POG65181.1 hypothetical protein GLOIN_2v1781977 [Rhizophagus irregularis DAOM 181602=DAOM 197198]GBC52476.2 hypothetical protein GLOIN_2v1781977 [Rhizophagus irregularis DAOM 181602=DAOM 197198]|eukprot:XP_025172047.1 hypothetical protein GLOIN_2v1781977 [Rhizophagus irregularis DAOM 181602=DAOM 197198]